MISGDIESRKLKQKSTTGKDVWTVEIGEDTVTIQDTTNDSFIIKENSFKNPVFIRKDSKTHFQYRIRNLPWEASNYLVEVDKEKDEVVVKTQNKKYYKRFSINDLKRRKMNIEPEKLKVEFLNGTLVISYAKPEIFLEENKAILNEIKRIKQEIETNPEKKYGSDCKNQ